jgi:hypothetical protein
VGGSASLEVGKFAGDGAESECPPVLPVAEFGAALDTKAKACVAANEESKRAGLLWPYRLQAQWRAKQRD